MVAELHIGDFMKGKVKINKIVPILNIASALPVSVWHFNNPILVMSFKYVRMVKKNVAYYDYVGIK